MLVNKRKLTIYPTGGSHSKPRPDKLLARRPEQYGKSTRSQRKRRTKLRQKKKQAREQRQEMAAESMEPTESGFKSKPRKQNPNRRADRQAKTEPRELAHSKEQSDLYSMSEE